MIASIRGQLLLVDGERAVIEVGGLGVEVLASSRTLGAVSSRLGHEVSLQTHLHVREDALQLFGFRLDVPQIVPQVEQRRRLLLGRNPTLARFFCHFPLP